MYDDWAEFYDEAYADQHSTGDLDFYRSEAMAANGSVLEAGCGTGRILLPTLAAGVDIDGFDASGPMLARLREGAAESGLQPRVWQADMRDFQAERRYALITCPFRAFLHLLTWRDQLQALARIRAHLLPGGRMLLNVFHPSYGITLAQNGRRALEDEFVHRATGRHTRQYSAVENDLVEQLKTVRTWFVELDEHGAVARATETSFRMAWIFKPQMELLLHAAGYARWTIHGGFDRRPLTRDDEEMVVEAWP